MSTRAPHRVPPGGGASLAVLLVLAACAPEPTVDDGVRELLLHPPHRLVDQPGLLVVDGSPPFGRLSPGGWARETERIGGRTVAWSKTAATRLLLPALEARDRRIVLELCAPDGAAPDARRAELSLNGQSLGWVRLGDVPEPAELDAPEPAWRRGDNVLEIRVPELTPHHGRGLCGVGVGGVRYDSTRSARVEDGEALLLPGTSLSYDVEVGRRPRVAVAGSLRGRGVLEVDVRRLGADGAAEAEPLAHERFLAQDEGFAREVDVPALPGELVRVQVALAGGGPGARLQLARLALLEEPSRRTPSIVFVSVDTFSARETSLLGNPRRTTPRLEALAREAVLFDDCRANAPWTVPSYLSQFTGLYPRAHELDREPGRVQSEWERRRLAPSRWTLAEALRARGYRTAAFVDNPWLARGLGFEQGFERFDAAAAELSWQDPTGGIDALVPRVAKWLDERRGDEPFFVFVQAFDPHAPYLSTAPWKGAFAGDGLDDERRLPVGHGQQAANGCIRPVTVRGLLAEPLPDELPVAPIVAAYHEKLLQVDAGIGRLLDVLRRRGLYEDTVVVVSADHGESLVLHDFHFGHSLLYDDVMRVPLIVRLPGGRRGGTVVETPVELVDLYPTLLGLAGSRFRPAELHGASLLPLVEGGRPEARTIYGEGGVCEQAFVVRDGWKLVASFPRSGPVDWQWTHPRVDRERLRALAPELADGWHEEPVLRAALARDEALSGYLDEALRGPVLELYRLADDPDEAVDVAAEHPDVTHALLELLVAERLRGEAARAGGELATPPEWTDDELARFGELGYFGD